MYINNICYLEYIDEKSNKFWEIHNHWNADKTYIEVRFGKIGSEGRTTNMFIMGLMLVIRIDLIIKNLKKERKRHLVFGFKTYEPSLKKSKTSLKT